jgi:branched-subunit amino acid aminotransferase/4-amino-4-deoxychorismate lyase
MTEDEKLFEFIGAALSEISNDEVLPGRLEVADSWLVQDGRARHLNEHYSRFAKWVIEKDPTVEFGEFFDLVTEQIPRDGAWFPRIEFITNAELNQTQILLRLREAPEREGTITLWSFNEPDPRLSPLIKGPDLSLGMQMRRAAQMHGADEAVLLSQDGFIIEGALSSIVWFRDDVLCAPDDEFDWIPSITRQEVFSIAESMGLQTRSERVKPADLVDLEIWALSSLHGIRAVDEWVDLGGPVGTPRHLEAFNKRMRMLSTSIDL